MAKIKDMAGASVGLLQDGFRLLPQLLPTGKQCYRIEIPLHRRQVSHVLPSLVERNPPIDSNDFRPGFLHRRQQGGAVGPEVNDRHASRLQAVDQLGGARQSVAVELAVISFVLAWRSNMYKGVSMVGKG